LSTENFVKQSSLDDEFIKNKLLVKHARFKSMLNEIVSNPYNIVYELNDEEKKIERFFKSDQIYSTNSTAINIIGEYRKLTSFASKLFENVKSIKNRKFTSLLCMLSIALSVALFLGIERIRSGARDGFTNTISKTDLIIGAKGGSLQLLLYTVFHIGGAVNNIRMSTYEELKNNPYVEWSIPISLGDSYKGHRVVATDENFFKHYRFRGDQGVSLKEGVVPTDTFDVVLGFDVAKKMNLKVGDPIVLTHGLAGDDILNHAKTPFKIVGVMNKTMTPIDTGVYITLYGMEAMHFGWETGVPSDEEINADRFKKENIQINQLTSFMVKLKTRKWDS
jgi:putative ABC transport system permease protein